MTTTSTELPGWLPPESPPDWRRPVQVEDATGGITMTDTPDGHAILMWPIEDDVHYAVIDNVRAALDDDVVTLLMIQNARTYGQRVERAVPFLVNDELFAIVMGTDVSTATYKIEILKANDPNSPSSWSVHGTVHPGADWLDSSGDGFGGPKTVSAPYITDGGRWVVCGGKSYQGSFGGTDFVGLDTGFWTSDNNGASWTQRHTYTNGFPGHSSSWAGTVIARDPENGFLLTGVRRGSGGIDGIHTYYSSDDGTTWAEAEYSDESGNLLMLVNNGDNIYACDANISDPTILRAEGSTWVSTGLKFWNTAFGGYHLQTDSGVRSRHAVLQDTLFYFARNRITSDPQHGWVVGRIAW